MSGSSSARAARGKQARSDLSVSGLVPLSAIDFPGRLSAVVFCQGCPWRCSYCHNPHLLTRTSGQLSWPEICAFLRRRQGLLDAVVFSGGEPTLQQGLGQAMRETRGLGFSVGLHTAGPYPQRIEALLPHLDWVGMDVKAPFSSYPLITGAKGSGERARRSVQILVASGIECEFRTTVDPALLDTVSVIQIADELSTLGVKRWVLQEARREGRANPAAVIIGTDMDVWSQEFSENLRRRFPDFLVRRAGIQS